MEKKETTETCIISERTLSCIEWRQQTELSFYHTQMIVQKASAELMGERCRGGRKDKGTSAELSNTRCKNDGCVEKEKPGLHRTTMHEQWYSRKEMAVVSRDLAVMKMVNEMGENDL